MGQHSRWPTPVAGPVNLVFIPLAMRLHGRLGSRATYHELALIPLLLGLAHVAIQGPTPAGSVRDEPAAIARRLSTIA